MRQLKCGMKNRILFVVTSHDKKGNTGQPTGFYLPEVTHPYRVLSKEGFEIDFVSPQGGKAPVDGVDLADPVNREFLDDPDCRSKIERTLSPDHVTAVHYDAVFFAGGHGTMWDFPENTRLAEIAAAIYEGGGVVGAVCHGPSGLVNIKLSNGRYLVESKEVAAFTNDEERAVGLAEVVPFLLADKLVERGAIHRPAPNWQEHVIVSDRLVTGQNPASAEGVGQAIASLLRDSQVAAAQQNSIRN
jgi:putative intracellular protease/amidase